MKLLRPALTGLTVSLTLIGCQYSRPGPPPDASIRDLLRPEQALFDFEGNSEALIAYTDIRSQMEAGEDDTIYAGYYQLIPSEAHDDPFSVVFRVVSEAGELLYFALPKQATDFPGDREGYFYAGFVNLEDTPSGIGADQASVYSLNLSTSEDFVDLALYDATDVYFGRLYFDTSAFRYVHRQHP